MGGGSTTCAAVYHFYLQWRVLCHQGDQTRQEWYKTPHILKICNVLCGRKPSVGVILAFISGLLVAQDPQQAPFIRRGHRY